MAILTPAAIGQTNTEGTLLASAARTATVQLPTQTNHNARGVFVVLNVTAASGTGGITPQFRAIDPISGTTVVLHATPPPAVTAVGRYGYVLYPGISVSAGTLGNGSTILVASQVLPRLWTMVVSPGDASSYTYSLSYMLLI